jgi:5-formyltetrahydrofolate cyclo-ligase
MPAKHDLRAELTRKRQELSDDDRAQASAQICLNLTSLAEFQSAQVIAAYAAMPEEVQLDRLIEHAWNSGKTLCLPWIRRGCPLQFFVVHRDTNLIRNRMGILQPDPQTAESIDARTLDLVVVPLLGFDRQCNRIGYGGGYYDRTFSFARQSSQRAMLLAGVGFEVQHVESLPTEPHDMRLDLVVTERRLLRSSDMTVD